jgi:diaminopimelate decarboxylase
MPRLTPIVHPQIKNVLFDNSLLFQLSDAFGSPLNLLFPEQLIENHQALLDVLAKYDVQSKIYYAHKPNKSQAVVRQAVLTSLNIDVASEKELVSAFANGFAADRIIATGPKSAAYIRLALQQNVLISVDNIEELQQIITARQFLHIVHRTHILLRVNDFTTTGSHVLWKDTKFGINKADIKVAFDLLVAQQKNIVCKGFAFHLDTAREEERVLATEACLHLMVEAEKRGLAPSVIDIGGGLKVNYLASKDEWFEYTTKLKEGLLGNKQESLTWNAAGVGYVNIQGILRGSPIFFDYYRDTTPAKQLDRYLSAPLAHFNNQSVGKVLSDHMIELYMEPGRGLLDQVGITLAQVAYVKKSAKGETLIGLSMNRSHLDSVDQEMMVDPILIKKSKKRTKPVDAYLVGNLCLEGDLIYRHKTFFTETPEDGDLIVFINTAAYNMDFVESETLQQSLAEKIAIICKKGKVQWYRDKNYYPEYGQARGNL